MADIKKRSGSDDCGGERGERGKRGHRGPAGTTEAVVVGGRSPDTEIIAGEDGPPGAPFYVDPGTAFLALNDTDQHAQVIGILGPSGMTAGQPVTDWTTDGALTLDAIVWGGRTGDVGGLVSGAAYYLDSVAGKLTTTSPPADDSAAVWTQIGVAISPSSLNVQISKLPPHKPSPQAAFVNFGASLEITTDTGPLIIPYSPGNALVRPFIDTGTTYFSIGFGSSVSESSADDTICWVSPIAATLASLRVNVSNIYNARCDFEIHLSHACNGPFSTVLEIDEISATGCYVLNDAILIAPGDRISFRTNVTKIS